MPYAYQLKITLLDTRPPVWRRVFVTSNTSLEYLCSIIQACFSWKNCQSSIFEMGNKTIHQEDDSERISKSLAYFLQGEGSRFHYLRYLGACWLHDVCLEKVQPLEAGRQYPRCLSGEQAAPYESGYKEHRHHPDCEAMWQWIGHHLDAKRCDIVAINRRLAALEKRVDIV